MVQYKDVIGPSDFDEPKNESDPGGLKIVTKIARSDAEKIRNKEKERLRRVFVSWYKHLIGFFLSIMCIICWILVVILIGA